MRACSHGVATGGNVVGAGEGWLMVMDALRGRRTGEAEKVFISKVVIAILTRSSKGSVRVYGGRMLGGLIGDVWRGCNADGWLRLVHRLIETCTSWGWCIGIVILAHVVGRRFGHFERGRGFGESSSIE